MITRFEAKRFVFFATVSLVIEWHQMNIQIFRPERATNLTFLTILKMGSCMIVTLFFFACNTAFGGVMLSTSIQNGSFESGLTNFSVVGNVTTETAAFGSGPTDGSSQAFLSTGGALVDIDTEGEIETLLGLSSGALDAIGATVTLSLIHI